jgi:hypothetical protein
VLGEVVEELARGTFDRAAVDRFVRDWGRFVIDHATNDDTRIMGQQMLERQDVEVPQLFYHLITRIPEYCGVASPDGDTLSTVDWDKPVLFVYGTGLYDVDYLALAQRGYMLVATLHYMRYEKGGREYGHWIVCVRNQNGEWELRNDMRSTSIIPNPFAAPGTVTAVIMARQ